MFFTLEAASAHPGLIWKRNIDWTDKLNLSLYIQLINVNKSFLFWTIFREAVKYYLADFFRWGGGRDGVSPIPLSFFGQNDFAPRGGRGHPLVEKIRWVVFDGFPYCDLNLNLNTFQSTWGQTFSGWNWEWGGCQPIQSLHSAQWQCEKRPGQTKKKWKYEVDKHLNNNCRDHCLLKTQKARGQTVELQQQKLLSSRGLNWHYKIFKLALQWNSTASRQVLGF